MFIGGLLFLGCGALLILVSIGDVWLTLRYKTSGAHATGTIVGTAPNAADKSILNPTVFFRTASGQEVQFKSVKKCAASDVGKSVEVVYLPKNPQNAEYASYGEWKALASSLGSIAGGIACVAIGAGLITAKYWLTNMMN